MKKIYLFFLVTSFSVLQCNEVLDMEEIIQRTLRYWQNFPAILAKPFCQTYEKCNDAAMKDAIKKHLEDCYTTESDYIHGLSRSRLLVKYPQALTTIEEIDKAKTKIHSISFFSQEEKVALEKKVYGECCKCAGVTIKPAEHLFIYKTIYKKK